MINEPKQAPEPAVERLFEALTENAGVYLSTTKKIAQIQTAYQTLSVHDTPAFGKIFRLDGANMTSERDEFFYHENIVHPALMSQTNPQRALVIGGGDGGSSEELLKYPSMQRVVMAELDADVIQVAREHFQAVHRGAFDDSRLEIRIGDGFAYLRETGEKFDAVVMDLTDPVGPAADLYSVDFFSHAKRVLTDSGTLTLHIGSPYFHRERFASTVNRLRDVFPIVRPYLVYVPLYGTWWGMACASLSTDPLSMSEYDIDSRIRERCIGDLQFYNGAMHRAVFALPNFVREIVND